MPGDDPLNVFDTLLMPLRLPGRVVGDIRTLTTAVVALQSDAVRHLGSVDERARELVDGLGALLAAIDRIEVRVADLESLEQTITERVDALREDLNARMLDVQAEVRRMRPPMVEMARDVAKIDDLLPDPADGPLTRLRDTLTSSR